VPAVVYGPLTVRSPVADPSKRKKGSQNVWSFAGLPVGSMPRAYQPSPKVLVGLPVPDSPVSVSRSVMPLAPKLIERSLPVRLNVTEVLNRLTLPLGTLAAVRPSPYHKSSTYHPGLLPVKPFARACSAELGGFVARVWLKSTSRYYAGTEDSHARAYEPVAPAREGMAAAMHLRARRARMRIAPAPTPLGP
jgi:hypothetical protein